MTPPEGSLPPGEPEFPPLDRTSPQATLRAILTGMSLGAVLALCNIYSGLKIGWSSNMSVTAALLGYGFWQLVSAVGRTRRFGILESNINQTAASAGAAISSAGLVAPIPALAMLTGQTLPWHLLALWVLSVALVGVLVGLIVRRQMLLVEKLPFPFGIASAETMKEMYAKGADAMQRVWVLIGGAITASVLKLAETLVPLAKLGFPGSFPATGALAAKGVGGFTAKNLGFALDPSLLMVGIGALIGPRSWISLLIGSLVGWAWLAPMALDRGWAAAGKPDGIWFGPLVQWLLWPGVTLMVASSLASFLFSWRAFIGIFQAKKDGSGEEDPEDVPRRWLIRGVIGVMIVSVSLQYLLFEVPIWTGAIGVLLTLVLVMVAARVSGETGITPVGPIGKVTQLIFGVIAPGAPAANLMAANVTGGGSSQAGDLLHDLKTGLLLGASPKQQGLAQACGVLAGSLAGSAAYLVLIPNPKEQLMTNEWPAPAVATWKAVAELFMRGFDAMPPGATTAIIIAAIAGVILASLEKVVPKRFVTFVPSASSLGLAMVLPAYNAMSMVIGGVLAWIAKRVAPSYEARFRIVLASGLVAGEVITGFGLALYRMLSGG